jgi:hypothetical protein
MFDTINHRIDASHNYPSTIVHKAAPTTESVRLLSELEKAARERVVYAGELQDNVFKAKYHIMADYDSMVSYIVYISFLFNGKEIRTEHSVSRYDKHDPPILYEAVRQKILEKLSEVITMDLFVSEMNEFKRILNEK